MDHARTQQALIEELAGAVLLAEADDRDAFAQVCDLLDTLATTCPGFAESTLAACRELAAGLARAESDEPASDLDALTQGIGELQQEATDGAAAADTATAVPATAIAETDRFELPEWVDEATFSEFLSNQGLVLEEIESEIMALEAARDDSPELASLRGHIHTLKGEAGVLGLDGVSQVCHAVEDFLEREEHGAALVDRLLTVKDWFGTALKSYAKRQFPTPTADQVAATLLSPMTEVAPAVRISRPNTKLDVTAEPEPEPEPEPAPTPHPEPQPSPLAVPAETKGSPDEQAFVQTAMDWDPDTLEVIEEFLQESNDSLTQADEILLGDGSQGIDDEGVNALFRVFHTIKGVAGYLELHEFTTLAHAAETILGRVRDGLFILEGEILDLTFDSTAQMRRMFDRLRVAAEREQPIEPSPEAAALVARLRAAVDPDHGHVPADRAATAAPQAATPALAAASSDDEGELEQGEFGDADGAADSSTGRRTKLKETVKVDLSRVDSLVEMIGELVIVESMVVHEPEISALTSPRVRKQLSQLAKITRDLQDLGMGMRMVPVRGLFQKMARMVRDLSRKQHKQIRAVLSGELTEMDRSMVEHLADPLVHMIRNAVDHALEGPDERAAAGKPATGTIRLAAYHEGGAIVIEIADDGRGLNRDAILRKAIERGIVSQGDNLSDAEINQLIFAPGFSTAQQVTQISGRGVGMDVVRRNIESMRGRISISSTAGVGTTFKLVLPLTLAIIDGMIVTCGKEQYIIPTLAIVESVRPTADMLFSYAGNGAMIKLRDEGLPLVRLDGIFGIPDAQANATDCQVVVLETSGGKLGLVVDEVIAQQQVVIKSLGNGLPNTNFLSGAAILSDGKVGLILNVDELRALVESRKACSAPNSLVPNRQMLAAQDIPIH